MRERLRHPMPENEMELSEFERIVTENIANVTFAAVSGARGNFQRLEDKILPGVFDPKDPSTWRQDLKVKQYRIFINPRLSIQDQTISFLKNVTRIRIDLERSPRQSSYDGLVRGSDRLRREVQDAYIDAERFYIEHREESEIALERFKNT